MIGGTNDSTPYSFDEFQNAAGYDFEDDFNRIDINFDEVINRRELKSFYEYMGKDINLTAIDSIIQ